jgi:uncharacterized protein YbbC (DUF1343 family)
MPHLTLPALSLLLYAGTAVGGLPIAAPADAGIDPGRLAKVDDAVQEALRRKQAKGAVVLVLRHGKVVHRKAYGLRAVQPREEPMTVDTVFDLASVTKPVATATAVMLLVERGQLGLADRVARHLPGFGKHGKGRITALHLLTHTSGLIADNPVEDYQGGKKSAIEKINDLRLVTQPGERFRYSDVGFIVLGQLVEKLSGESLDRFVHKNVFEPLGMRDTAFRPSKALAERSAPTEKEKGGPMLHGQVHDPRARLMGGVAGHAGLFGTADDLAVYAAMLLGGGEHDGKRILSPTMVRLMTAPRPVNGGLRALGWDVRTSYSANRGELFGGFGHTGFTGTSLWIDPPSQTAVILLTSRLHPNGKGNVVPLRRRVATLVAASIVKPPFPEPHLAPAGAVRPVLCGQDVLKRDGFKPLKGRRVGLVTNHTGKDRDGQSTIDLLHKAQGVKLVALFSPEHGIRGALDAPVPDGKDQKTGLPVYSLYGKTRRPTAKQLEGIDTLVYDIQDIGCRFYTYITTLGYLLETAAAHKLRVVVLDRPNPIGGLAVEGPVLEKGQESFVAYHALPVRHGLTVGELATLFNKERRIGADLRVIKVEGWRRGDLFDRTGLTWVNPSPNMRSLAAALLYPGVGLLETTNVSVGRGTDRPFELLGAPWLDGRRLAAALAGHDLPGVRFVPTRFTPSSSVHAKKECGGVQLYVSDWDRFQPLLVGITIACELRRLHPNDWQRQRYNTLLGHTSTLQALERGDTPAVIVKTWQDELAKFAEVRSRYLLYP